MRCSWLWLAGLIVALMCVLPTSGRAGLIDAGSGSGPLTIGLAPTDLRLTIGPTTFLQAGKQQTDMIARTVSELFGNYIRRGFEKGLDRPVLVVPANSLTSGQGPSIIIRPVIESTGDLGVRISAQIRGVDFKTGITYGFEEFLLLSPTSNFGEVDTKLSELSALIAKRIVATEAGASYREKVGLPRGIARFYCIIPSEPENKTLQQLGTRLSLELPFHLTEAARAGP